MKINLYLLIFLIIPPLISSEEENLYGSCSKESKDQECGSYCYQVVKPLLDYAASIRTKELQFVHLESKLREQETNLVNLKFQLSQQIELTASYKSNNALQEKQLAANDVEISALKSLLTAKEAQIDEKDKQIKSLKAQLKGNESNNDKISQLEAKFADCKKLSIAQICEGKTNDVHMVKVPDLKPFSISCDSKLAGSSWTVIQRRKDGSENFNRTWAEYKTGFGNSSGEFFIGLEILHILTQSQPHELYIYLQDFNYETRFAKYSHFLIGNETEAYELKIVGNYSGTANDTLKEHLNMKFATPDKDNEANCASYYVSGWWHNKCFTCNLNGKYAGPDFPAADPRMGIYWNNWHIRPMKFVQMMIRPKSL